MKDEIRFFLTSPLAFAGSWSATDRTISVLGYTTDGVRVNGKLESPVGPLIGWGKATPNRNRYYYGSSNSGFFTSREIENVQTNGNVISFKVCNVTSMRYSPQTQYYNNDAAEFSKLAYMDQRNRAFLESIPGLQEQFKNFVDDTFQWWVHTEESRAAWQEAPRNNGGREPNTFISKSDSAKATNLVDVTNLLNGENMATLEGQLQAITDIATDPKEKINEFTLETYSKLGMTNGPNSTFLYQRRNHNNNTQQNLAWSEDFNWIPAPETSMRIRSWVTKDQNKVSNEPINLLNGSKRKHTDFTVNFEANPSNSYKIYAQFTWIRVNYVHEKTVTKTRRNNWQGRRTTQYNRNSENRTIFLPVIDSFCLEILPGDLASLKKKKHHRDISGMYAWNNQNSLTTATNTPFHIDNLQRVRDATKKRAAKGGYRGGYQGISKLSVGSNDLLKHVTLSNFSDIAGGSPITSYSALMKEQKRTIPLTLEQYKDIERPEIEIKPVEIGHLNFYRLSNPPKRLVVGDTLSDLLLPSMPALLIAVDVDLSVTNGESFTSGEHCSGDCQKEEKIDCILLPGLYLVERKIKCALGHDPGRPEYNNGFGDTCNEIITIRNMLSQLNIAYDEYRGNMVGNTNSHRFATQKANSGAFLGRLG